MWEHDSGSVCGGKLTPATAMGFTAAAAPAAPGSAVSAKKRDSTFDNAKLILSSFISCGHIYLFLLPGFMDRIQNSENVTPAVGFWAFIHVFSMPSFVLMSGHFAKNFVQDSTTNPSQTVGRTRANMVKILFPFFNLMAFTFGLSLLRDGLLQYYYSDSERMHHLGAKFMPGQLAATVVGYRPFLFDANWYLFALFLWKVSVVYIHQVRWPISCAFGVNVLGTLISWQGHGIIAQAVGFYPFFVVGMFAPPSVHKYMRQLRVQLVSTAALFALLVACLLVPDVASHIFVYHHGGMHWSGGTGSSPSLLFVLTNWTLYFSGSFAGSFCFFSFASLVLSKPIPYVSVCGQKTLYNYCLHMELLGLANMGIVVLLQPGCVNAFSDGQGRMCAAYATREGSEEGLCTVHPPYGIPYWNTWDVSGEGPGLAARPLPNEMMGAAAVANALTECCECGAHSDPLRQLFAEAGPLRQLLLGPLMAVMCTIVLTSRPATWLLQPIIEPECLWLLKPVERPPQPQGSSNLRVATETDGAGSSAASVHCVGVGADRSPRQGASMVSGNSAARVGTDWLGATPRPAASPTEC